MPRLMSVSLTEAAVVDRRWVVADTGRRVADPGSAAPSEGAR